MQSRRSVCHLQTITRYESVTKSAMISDVSPIAIIDTKTSHLSAKVRWDSVLTDTMHRLTCKAPDILQAPDIRRQRMVGLLPSLTAATPSLC